MSTIIKSNKTKTMLLKTIKVFLLLSVLVIISCGDDGVGPITNSLEENYIHWKKLGIDSYSIVQQRLCFCYYRGAKVTIQIRGDKIMSIIDSVTSKQIPQESWQWYKTIDQLFDEAIKARDSKPATFNLELDSTYGFPKYYWVDPNMNMADEEYGFTTTGFKIER